MNQFSLKDPKCIIIDWDNVLLDKTKKAPTLIEGAPKLLQTLRSTNPQAKIIVFSKNEDEESIIQTLTKADALELVDKTIKAYKDMPLTPQKLLKIASQLIDVAYEKQIEPNEIAVISDYNYQMQAHAQKSEAQHVSVEKENNQASFKSISDLAIAIAQDFDQSHQRKSKAPYAIRHRLIAKIALRKLNENQRARKRS